MELLIAFVHDLLDLKSFLNCYKWIYSLMKEGKFKMISEDFEIFSFVKEIQEIIII